MLAAERHRRIIEKLGESGAVKVSELSELFSVTEKTVREDLEKLEEKGLLKRTHGGAVLEQGGEDSFLPLQIPNAKHQAEKAAIATLALSCIEPNDIIALDAGSSTLELARQLPNMPLTVLTNDLLIIRELTLKDAIRLVVPGGYRHNNLLIGGESQEWINRLNVHKLFLSTTGIHPEYGLTIFTEELAKLKRLYIDNARRTYVIADHSKFDRGALITYAALNDVHCIITDGGISPEVEERYEALGLTIMKAEVPASGKRTRGKV
ncbi:DeoR/GlpR family DNA-binding transcription regulator [Paenibacillus sp. PAMC21692]|jgi:DeoR family fructose operon transcriptional repressor|uniref:DeoR/GlpR family DNA-binding transcription regulator n=1 Tax=Paenibacillus sp. PAMC21692 TaxID=2762320 RepID=UPI00164D4AD9|nr:DeoR/GlpR family DNA-binding transcription regulator [Paenibacillus sp. PAMC21692]QNK59794.1 DeoR/GlpR transcriptional regulator [Paenibacillus sp. PAMC21692]